MNMKMIRDDHHEVYVWVDSNDEKNELSPRFDYEEDADSWYYNMIDRLKHEIVKY